MMLPCFYPRNCMIGTVAVTDDGTHTPAIGLYNNSTGNNLIVIRNLNASFAQAAAFVYSYVTQGIIGSASGTAAPFMTGDVAAGGALYADAGTNYTVKNYNWNELVFATPAWVHDFPFVGIQPGQTWVLWTPHISSQVMTVSLFWQVVPAEGLTDRDY